MKITLPITNEERAFIQSTKSCFVCGSKNLVFVRSVQTEYATDEKENVLLWNGKDAPKQIKGVKDALALAAHFQAKGAFAPLRLKCRCLNCQGEVNA